MYISIIFIAAVLPVPKFRGLQILNIASAQGLLIWCSFSVHIIYSNTEVGSKKYIYSVTFTWVHFLKICTFKSRFKDGYFYFNSSTFLTKKRYFYFATVGGVPLVPFIFIVFTIVKKRIVYFKRTVSFIWGMNDAPYTN